MLVITEKTMEQGFQINIYEIIAPILSEIVIMTPCACNCAEKPFAVKRSRLCPANPSDAIWR
jgi:hypothetical protein